MIDNRHGHLQVASQSSFTYLSRYMRVKFPAPVARIHLVYF